jgi:glycyl-tRNA synthetase alpha chain
MNKYNFRWVQRRLEEFWEAKGVSILLPYDVEMGAATYSPFSTIKMMEENQLSVAFIQKCRRPYDSMAGEKGNRLYSFHQFQVMLKGGWPMVVEDFIESLNFIGLPVAINDLKFVESDWNSPSIGAYGVGWEVQWNGMEIAQFTHFKKIALVNCKEPITELTYGVERLLMKLTEKDNIYDCMWDSHRSYGSLTRFYEQDLALAVPVIDQIAHLDDFNRPIEQAEILIKAGAIYHGYEYILKACHVYNLLEMSNQLGTFQRGKLIKIMQNTFHQCFVDKENEETKTNEKP